MTARSESIPLWIDPKTGEISLDVMNAAYAQERNNIRDYVQTYTSFTLDESLELSPDAVSVRYYGTTIYWWIILLFNNITIVDDEFVMGLKVYLPNITQVRSWLDLLVSRSKEDRNSSSVLNQRFVEI